MLSPVAYGLSEVQPVGCPGGWQCWRLGKQARAAPLPVSFSAPPQQPHAVAGGIPSLPTGTTVNHIFPSDSGLSAFLHLRMKIPSQFAPEMSTNYDLLNTFLWIMDSQIFFKFRLKVI